MHLSADQVFAEPKADDYPITVGFRDTAADYCVILSRFSDLEPDRGTIEVLVRDQVHAETANLLVSVSPNQCHVTLDEPTAATLLGVREYIIDYQVNSETYSSMLSLLHAIFDGLPGLSVVRDVDSG
jgi:hypothetical protein